MKVVFLVLGLLILLGITFNVVSRMVITKLSKQEGIPEELRGKLKKYE